jgi:hypothetical protein
MEDFSETFIATIHDSILTTPDAPGSIRAIVMQEFAGVGLAPTIRIEDFGASSGGVARTPLRLVEARS